MSPSDTHVLVSARALLVVILGGGTVWGPAGAAIAVAWLEELFTNLTDHWLVPPRSRNVERRRGSNSATPM